VHHTRKPAAGTNGEITVEDGRGAGALLAAVRSARVLNRMTKDEAAGIDVDNYRLFFRIDNGKANLAPPSDAATWCQLVSVDLPNGDSVGVVAPWAWPDPFSNVTSHDLREVQKRIHEGDWRIDVRAKNWAGNLVAEVLDFAQVEKDDRPRLQAILRTWVNNGALKIVRRKNEQRKEFDFIEVGTWAAP
jgi:hypothetical protein